MTTLSLPFAEQPSIRRIGEVLRVALPLSIAGVWLYHGLYNKLLGGEPRHLMIVQSVPMLGGEVGLYAMWLIGAAEMMLAMWVLTGWRRGACAAVQTIALLAMNVAELTWAREHLIWPAGLVPVNLLFLTLVCVWALDERAIGLYMLRRHPVAVRARFEHSLVLTYALPRETLQPLLPPGLELDAYGEHGFLAAAFVQTRELRPAPLPRWIGQDLFLAGYRVFVKFRTPQGRTLRGLWIMRSDADRWRMVIGGNALTHYNYRKCAAAVDDAGERLHITVRTLAAAADVDVTAALSQGEEHLPARSVFPTLHDARRYAGPLPWTFDYETQTHSIIAIKGVRQNWRPKIVPVDVRTLSLFDRPPFDQARPVLASAFHVRDIAYRWERGVRHALPRNDTRRPYQGVLQIMRYNWPMYACASAAMAGALIAATMLPPPVDIVLLVGAALAGVWMLASIAASHWIYDRSPLTSWRWIHPALGFSPQRWVNLHAGVDEATATLGSVFRGSEARVFDIFDPGEMTEPSIHRARRVEAGRTTARPSGDHVSERVDFRRLPIADGSVEAAFLLLSAHELRSHEARVTLLRELRRILSGGGRIVLAEHLRDLPNFLAFGPGFLHFHSQGTWAHAFRAAGLEVQSVFRITPFIGVFVLRRAS